MTRLYFYVVDVGDGWEVSPQPALDGFSPVRYADHETAISGAVRFARAEWTTTHLPTGVRVQSGLGEWRDERTFGRPPPLVAA